MSIARAADEIAIHGLVARYADAVTRRDEAAWRATWAEDGEWRIMGSPTKGRDAVVALWRTLMGSLPFVMQIANGGIVETDGDRGLGRWYITEHQRSADGTGSLILGVYHDEYRRLGGEWRFARRHFDILYAGPPDLSGQLMPFPEKVEIAGSLNKGDGT